MNAECVEHLACFDDLVKPHYKCNDYDVISAKKVHDDDRIEI